MFDFATEVDQLVAEMRAPEVSTSGKLVRVVGLTLEAKGIIAPLGAHCQVENLDLGTFIDAEVVGFQDDLLYLMPFSEPGGVGPGARVWVRSNHSKASLGRASRLRITTRHQHGSGRSTNGAIRDGVIQHQTLGCQPVDVRGLDLLLAVQRQR